MIVNLLLSALAVYNVACGVILVILSFAGSHRRRPGERVLQVFQSVAGLVTIGVYGATLFTADPVIAARPAFALVLSVLVAWEIVGRSRRGQSGGG